MDRPSRLPLSRRRHARLQNLRRRLLRVTRVLRLRCRRRSHQLRRRTWIFLTMRLHAATGIAAIVRGHRIDARIGQHPPRRSAHRAQTMRHRTPMLFREPARRVLRFEQRLPKPLDGRTLNPQPPRVFPSLPGKNPYSKLISSFHCESSASLC